MSWNLRRCRKCGDIVERLNMKPGSLCHKCYGPSKKSPLPVPPLPKSAQPPPLPKLGGKRVKWNYADDISKVLMDIALEIDALHQRIDELEQRTLGNCAECDALALPGDYLCKRHRECLG